MDEQTPTTDLFTAIDAYFATDEGRIVRQILDTYDKANQVYQRAMDAMYRGVAARWRVPQWPLLFASTDPDSDLPGEAR